MSGVFFHKNVVLKSSVEIHYSEENGKIKSFILLIEVDLYHTPGCFQGLLFVREQLARLGIITNRKLKKLKDKKASPDPANFTNTFSPTNKSQQGQSSPAH